jgi:hypothetical protein
MYEGCQQMLLYSSCSYCTYGKVVVKRSINRKLLMRITNNTIETKERMSVVLSFFKRSLTEQRSTSGNRLTCSKQSNYTRFINV